MKFRYLISLTALFFISLFSFEISMAATCPNYLFETDLSQGMTHPDVRVIQEILNMDKRTLVANSGPGSKGNETQYFGLATREALKRFQALFIEYIAIANGKFGPRTKTTMNAVCKGPFFTGGKGDVYEIRNNINDKIPPVIAIASVSTTTIDQPVRAFLGSNEPLDNPTLAGLIISNATAGDFRKTGSTTYSFLVTPNSDATGNISIQYEAESVSDLVGNKNENASNEWIIALESFAVEPEGATTTFEFPNIDLPIVLPSESDCNRVSNVDINDYTNPCYGKVPMSYASMPTSEEGGGGGGGQSQIMQILQGLLQSMVGKGLASLFSGGKGGPPGVCMCPPMVGQPTTFLNALGGVSGGALMTANPGVGSYNGFVAPFPGICGQAFIKGKCINPKMDSLGRPIMFVLPGGNLFKWMGL